LRTKAETDDQHRPEEQMTPATTRPRKTKTFAEREAELKIKFNAANVEASDARTRASFARTDAKNATGELKILPAAAHAKLESLADGAAQRFYELIVDDDWIGRLLGGATTPAVPADALAEHLLAQARDGKNLVERINDAIDTVPIDPRRSTVTDRSEPEIRADIEAANKRAEAADKATVTAEAKARAANAALRAL
jgi:hypothetical protein